MILSFNKILKTIRKKNELIFLLILVLISIISTQFYNNQKKITDQKYISLVNNLYFQKSINHIFDNLSPKYIDINHKISQGETFDKILSGYFVSEEEIIKVKKSLTDSINLNNLKTNQILKFTVDQSKNKHITSFLFPISRTEKIQLTRNLETNLFEKKKNYHKLN